jgi:hypothetical protein
LANKGRTKQVNAALRIYEGSSQIPVYPLYCLTRNDVKRMLRKMRKENDAKNRPAFIFQHFADHKNVSMWVVLPL